MQEMLFSALCRSWVVDSISEGPQQPPHQKYCNQQWRSVKKQGMCYSVGGWAMGTAAAGRQAAITPGIRS